MTKPNLVTPEVEALAVDLAESGLVEVHYLDESSRPQKIYYSDQALGETVRIEMRPHLVVTRQIQHSSDPDDWGTEDVAIPLERALLVLTSTVGDELDQFREIPRAHWVNGPEGKLLRLTP